MMILHQEYHDAKDDSIRKENNTMKTNAMKRKLIFLLSGLVLLLCLAACSQKDNTDALTKWYNSKDRTQIERQINNLYQAQGLKFSLTVEEPDTIVYNYQYTNANSALDATTQESISSMLKVFMDSAAPAVKSDIEQYQKTYHLPVKNIRMIYLDSDGNELFSMDIDENYEPSDAALAKQYKNLAEWLDNGKDSFVSAINPSLEPSGISMDFDADGETLILIYRFIEMLDLSDYTQEDLEYISDYFIQSMDSSGSDVATMIDGLEVVLGFKIKDMRIQIRNADDSLICDVPTSDLR